MAIHYKSVTWIFPGILGQFLTKPQFGVASTEVVIIYPEIFRAEETSLEFVEQENMPKRSLSKESVQPKKKPPYKLTLNIQNPPEKVCSVFIFGAQIPNPRRCVDV